MSNVSGMAASIRAATESETFDLGGQTVSTITNTVQSAFQEPLEGSRMIRLTFVTGAGKQARQKYDEGAAKAVTSTLTKLCGFTEDRGASCIMECAGTFKLQHDTGKNLKTVVVFPKMVTPNQGDNAPEDETIQTLIPEGDPKYMIATSPSMNVFQRMMSSRCPSWNQKKGCVAAIEALKGMVADLDSKLIKGKALSPAEQHFYDSVSILDEKELYVKSEMHAQVERGDITEWEWDTLLRQNSDRLSHLQQDIKEAERAKAKKKVEKLKSMLEKAKQRKALLIDIQPKAPHKLRNEEAIRKLRKELMPLLGTEEGGRLRSVKETQNFARKEELQEEIASLENNSRGWFEDDDAFNARVEASQAAFAASQASKKGKKATTSAAGVGGKTSSVNKWVLPGDMKKGAWGNKTGPSKKKKSKGGAVFAAMMMEDDDDDNDTENNGQASIRTGDHGNSNRTDGNIDDEDDTHGNEEPTGSNKKTKKKGKKKKKKQQQQQSEDDALEDALAKRKAEEEKKKLNEEPKDLTTQAFHFVRHFLLPAIAAMIAWIVTAVFGKPKRRPAQRR